MEPTKILWLEVSDVRQEIGDGGGTPVQVQLRADKKDGGAGWFEVTNAVLGEDTDGTVIVREIREALDHKRLVLAGIQWGNLQATPKPQTATFTPDDGTVNKGKLVIDSKRSSLVCKAIRIRTGDSATR